MATCRALITFFSLFDADAVPMPNADADADGCVRVDVGDVWIQLEFGECQLENEQSTLRNHDTHLNT